ncbi:MAG TPA: ABC transporter ATP-binding protein [Nitrososphaerales archaeon]|nr:ABC transporter ATP-binding protein [Nitrososphaerales archaeon]
MRKDQAVEPYSPLLQIRNLIVEFSKGRGRKNVIRALSGVSLDLYESEVFSVVGESGSGKTTLARCIARLETPTSGQIRYNGTDIAKFGGKKLRQYRKDVQIVFQDPFESFNPRQSVLSSMSVPLRFLDKSINSGSILEKASRLLTEVGLDPLEVLYKLPHQLSGGEKQRINIARALAPSPKILIADEPITMIDASQKLEILSLLAGLKESRKLTILLVTHDLAAAKIMADRVGVMYLGKFVEMGPCDSVLALPHHPYTELILDSTPDMLAPPKLADSDDDISLSHLEVGDATTGGSCCSFRSRCKYATRRCAEVEPVLEEKTQLHFAACHNYLSKQYGEN